MQQQGRNREAYEEEKKNQQQPIAVGPWGGGGGRPWNDGAYTAVRKVVVVHGAAIDSVQIEYDRKGCSVWSKRHGGDGGTKTDQVKLDHPHEVLTSISGHYGSISNGGSVVIRSLTFESTRTKYGPFGFQQGTHFSFPMRGGKIVGFHGRSGWFIDSIGFYLKHLQNPSPSKALIPFSSHSSDKTGYNATEGTMSKGYDIVLAVRERGDNYKILSNNHPNETFSQEARDVDLKNNVVAFPSSTLAKGASTLEGLITYGPWGGNGGIIFDDGIYTGVQKINLTRNAGITSVQVKYDQNGHAVWGSRHGGGGIRSDKIVFDHPSEVLTNITGYYGTTLLMGPTAVKSLTFHTTKRKYGPYGEEQGMFFSSNLTNGRIVGFHGRNGWYIDSIGVHVLEEKISVPQTMPTNNSHKGYGVTISEVDNPQWSNKLVLARRGVGEEVTYGVIKEPIPCGPGPWGGDGGKPWDDGVFSGIKQIFLTRGDSICSIQIEYDRNGQSIWSVRHGGGGETTHKIKFDYPNEVLKCICGFYDSIKRDGTTNVIKSLTFYTSRGKYGPYGEELGTFFTSTTTEGKVVGFHGRSGLYLNAIGVHMQHWLGEKRASHRSMLSKFFN